MFNLICAHCFCEFTRKYVKRTYCSVKCKSLHLNKSIKSKMKEGKEVNCGNCGKCIYKPKSHLKKINFCCASCRSKVVIQVHKFPNKKEKPIFNNPRKRIMINGKRVYEHRYIMEIKIGRKLDKKEHVHHINGNCQDNSIENLMILSSSDHARIEIINRKNSIY